MGTVYARSFGWLRANCIARVTHCYTPIVLADEVGTSIMGFADDLKENMDPGPSRTVKAWYTSCYAYDADVFAVTRFYVEIEATSGD